MLFRSYARANGGGQYSEVVASSPVAPYGPPSAPSVSCELGGKKQKHAVCSWTPGANNGAGTSYEQSDDAGNTEFNRFDITFLTCVVKDDASLRKSRYKDDPIIDEFQTDKQFFHQQSGRFLSAFRLFYPIQRQDNL